MGGRRLCAVVVSLLVAVMAAAVPAAAQAPLYTHATGVEYEVLSTDTKDPLFIQVAPDGRIFWAEREGRLAVLHPDGRQDVAGILPVSANACNEAYCPTSTTAELEEGGLYSILLAPDFMESGHIYTFRSVPGSAQFGDINAVPGNPWRDTAVCFAATCPVADNFGVWRLSRFTVDANSKLLLDSEQTVFEVPAEWVHCCHYGGNLEWLPDGTILLSTGDDMTAGAGSYGQSTNPLQGDAERTSMNPADRRGKILRLNPDGSVPDGSVPGVPANPFLVTDANGVAVRDANGQLVTEEVEHTTIPDTWGPDDGLIAHDPYVYTLGYKQPFRGAVHPSGAAIFGEVGPDGFVPYPGRGPRGVEELNEVPYGGGVNHGWPRCSGNNDPYYPYDGVEGLPSAPIVGGAFVPGQPFDCSGMEPAVLWYPHDVSERWPSLGSGGVTSAPSTFYPASTDGPLRLPKAFDDNLLFMEESRSGIIGMPMTADGHLVTDESEWTFVAAPTGSPAALTAPSGSGRKPARPIDATVGPDGAVYIVEYSNGFYNGTASAITRLKCSGCTDALSEALGNVPVAESSVAAVTTRRLPLAAITVLAGLVMFVLRRRKAVV